MSMPVQAAEILKYWTDIGPQGWYAGGEALDTEIRDRFLVPWTAASRGAYLGWQASAEGALAYIILTDQFPRNMFRGDARSFATDARARAVTSQVWQKKIDMRIEGPLRQFFYMPLMHSENSFDQDRTVCLMAARMPDRGAGNLLHARAHREIIRKYHRFPFRNEALGRVSTAEELTFMAKGGYAEFVREMES